MSMLAEKRKKKKLCPNPNGNYWSKDDNKLGQQMLEKMGWKKGSGLGVNLQGTKEHVKVLAKSDTKGLGCTDTADREWIQHQQNFENLLSDLSTTLSEDGPTNEASNVSVSLEEKSKNSRVRVHYQKFTRGKDVSQYSPSDLASIFGKKANSQENRTFEMGLYKDNGNGSSETDTGCKFSSVEQPTSSTNVEKSTFVLSSDPNENECGVVDLTVNNLSTRHGHQEDNVSNCREDIKSKPEKQTKISKKLRRSNSLSGKKSSGTSIPQKGEKPKGRKLKK